MNYNDHRTFPEGYSTQSVYGTTVNPCQPIVPPIWGTVTPKPFFDEMRPFNVPAPNDAHKAGYSTLKDCK